MVQETLKVTQGWWLEAKHYEVGSYDSLKNARRAAGKQLQQTESLKHLELRLTARVRKK